MKKDLYETLSVNRTVNDDELKKAYRKLAMKYHPDQNPGDKEAEKKFKEISSAYDILKDPQKRAAYDQMGHAAFEQGGTGGGHSGAGGFGGHPFSDIFEEMFGQFSGGFQSSQSVSMKGSDIRYNMDISLEEAFKGVKKSVKSYAEVSCSSCKGSGSESGTQPITCPSCQGRGKTRAQQGFFTIERTCSQCQGIGRIIKNPCKSCSGLGRKRGEKSLEVSIPAGIEDGMRIRLSGEGEAGTRGGPSGDLYAFISVKPHRLFKREGAAIHCRVPIPMVTAALSGSIEVPVIDGSRAKVTIPAGTQNGHRFRLKSKGMPLMRRGTRGDMYIEAAIETPVNLSKKQIELLKEFESLDKRESTSPQSHGFFSKVKEFWDDLNPKKN